MIYTSKLQKAIDFAIKVHQLDQNQKRKGKEIPYIVHPLSIGIILAMVGAEEDVIIAGILHDTIEDSLKTNKITKQQIAIEFGDKVAEMVNDVTEQDKSQSWDIRKKNALDHISKMGQGSILVKSADVLHNMRDQIEDFKNEGNKMFQRFNAPKEKQIDRYKKLIEALNKTWKDNPLLEDLRKSLNTLLENWK